MNRIYTLIFVIFVTSSLLIIKPSDAQTIPKPSLPEFSVQIVAYPYDVPTTHSIDPYTGQDITHQGYHVENKSIEVKIKNQPFTPFWIQENPQAANWTVNSYYNIRIRGHFSQTQEWLELYRASDGFPHQWLDSDYTILSYSLAVDSYTYLGTKMINLTAGGEIDFQVEAMIGYVYREVTPVPGGGWLFTGETSGWSPTQTITVSASSSVATATPSPTESLPNFNPTSTPTQTLGEFSITLAFVAIVISIFCIMFLLLYVRHLKRRLSEK